MLAQINASFLDADVPWWVWIIVVAVIGALSWTVWKGVRKE